MRHSKLARAVLIKTFVWLSHYVVPNPSSIVVPGGEGGGQHYTIIN